MVDIKSLTELIDDREIQEWESDRFRHQDVANQLADLAASVKTPANVALYGPWGSGKTGVANLLRSRLRQPDFIAQHGEIESVRFDAFKYAEVPLRRHFLSQLAVELLTDKEAERFRRDLYHSQSQTDIDFRAIDVWRALRVFLGLLVAGLVIAVLVAGVVAGLFTAFTDAADPGFWDRARTYFSGVVGFSFAPAAVLAGLFAIAGKSLPVTRSRDIPSTDEEFERQFRELLKESGAEKLVVFVDELDRCPPNRVVDVLDTVRTFLDVEGTVFIVAADQHVLERALIQKVAQTTPPDPTNPYYSSGSAYLDKVFHYQMSLPALLPGRVTQYAVQLVAGRPGVWSNSAIEVPWVVSILIPTHVRSPRRVKTLLNNFVLAFRLAHRRFEEGHLSSNPAERALELAKLVTLRTEFPSFARELTLSSRLPELFLALAENSKAARPPEVPIEVWEKAVAFARDDIAVDQMLDQRDSSPEEEEDSDGDASSDEAAAVASTQTTAALRQQLHHYLLKTRHIPNPARDLLFLEGQGHLYGLEESLAQEVEDAAIGGRPNEVAALVDEQDLTVRVSIIRLLASRAREAFPGVEGQNLVGVLLAVSARQSDDVLGQCADEAIDAVNSHSDHGDLSKEHLPGAFLLGLRSHRAGSNELVSHVLASDEAATDNSLARLIVENAGQLSEPQLGRAAEIATVLLLDQDTARDAVAAIHGLPNANALLNKARAPIERIFQAAIEADEQSTLDQPTDDGSLGTVHRLVLSFEEAMEQAVEVNSDQIANCLLLAAFTSSNEEFWISAGHYIGLVDRDRLVEKVQAAALKRASSMTPDVAGKWLESLPDGYAHTDEHLEDATDLVEVFWRHRSDLGDDYSKHDGEFVGLMNELRRIQGPNAASERVGIVSEIAQELGPAATDMSHTVQLSATWNHLRRFIDCELIPGEAAADAVSETLVTTFNGQPTPPPVGDDIQFRSFVTSWSLWAARHCSTPTAANLVTSITDCLWLTTPAKESLALRVASIARARDDDVRSPYDASTVGQLARAHGQAIQLGVGAWIKVFAGEPAAAYQTLEPFIRAGHYEEVSESVKTYASRLDSDGRLELARLETASSNGGRLNVDFLRDVRFHDADDIAGADMIVDSYRQTGTNNNRRRDLLDAWGVLQPVSQSARHRLIDNVVLPMLTNGGRQALDHVKGRMSIIAIPEGRKNSLRDALRTAAGGKDADKRLESLMLDHGILTQRRKGRFGWGKEEVDETD